MGKYWMVILESKPGGRSDTALGTGWPNWLFAGSLWSGQRGANVMSLIQSAKLNGHGPYEYLKDVLMRLPTQRVGQIDELLPLNWKPTVDR